MLPVHSSQSLSILTESTPCDNSFVEYINAINLQLEDGDEDMHVLTSRNDSSPDEDDGDNELEAKVIARKKIPPHISQMMVWSQPCQQQ